MHDIWLIMISKIDKLIMLFGGVNRMAKLVGVKPPSVIGWRYRRCIPSRRIHQIAEAGAQLNPPIILEPNDFFECQHPASTYPLNSCGKIKREVSMSEVFPKAGEKSLATGQEVSNA
ncbi:carph-isopro domain-containing protein [Komagataeibacter europaeus]|uniref:carph-isopro domain-containing protein n=1 Tax=Komagataeibacter europaeus TaxID=33995 RepID=UPI0038CF7AC1